MSGAPSSYLPSEVILGAVAVVALFLTVSRGWADDSEMHLRGAVRIAWVTLLLQALHFTEELTTGLYERFPALFDLAPVSRESFAAINLVALGVWVLSIWGLAARHRAALFPLWFLGVACLVNGVLHPAAAIATGSYFPGLITAPLVGIAGVVLVRRMLRITRAANG